MDSLQTKWPRLQPMFPPKGLVGFTAAACCSYSQDGIGPSTLHPKAPELGGGASGERTVPRGVLG